jgi:hypothetical protein
MADFQQPVKVDKTETGVVLQLPDKALDAVDTVIVLKVKGKLNVERLLPGQDEDGVLVLAADAANIHNPGYGGKIKLNRNDHSDAYLDEWTDYRSQVDWLVKIDQPGRFDVYADVAVEDASGFLLEVDEEEKPFRVQSTNGLQTYQTQHIGQLDLPEGEVEVRIFPQESLWKPVSFRSLTLKPADKQ